MMRWLVAAALCSAAAVSAQHPGTVAAASAGAKIKSADADKKVCRATAVTGSVLGGRVCHTRREWDALDRGNAADTGDFRDRSTNLGLPPLAGRGG